MSSYKSHRRPATTSPDPNAFQVDSKYRIGVDKLRELFPNWTDQDLQSVLAEVAGDVSIAATRITEGYAEQWGNVSRKKDKKTSAPQSNSGPTSNGNSQVGGVPRGGRGGGRGGRGGFSRGGRGGGPGAVGRVPSARDVNGSKQDADASKPTDSVTNGIQTSTTDSWVSDAGGWHSQEPAPDGSETVAQPEPVESTTLPEPTQSATKSSAWDTAVPNETPSQAKPTVAPPLKSSKVPTGAKLSWAQIARAQEKPKPTPPAPPIAPAPVQPPTPVEVSSTAPEPQEQPAVPQWEEPTTAEAPTWDDEPPYVQPPQAEADSTTKKEEDGWIGSEDSFVVVSKPAVAEEEAPAPPSSTIVEPPASVASSLTTPSLTTATTPSASSPAPSTSPKPSTPRPTNTSRMAHRFKADQAVVMPSFGTIGGVTSLGMQFGSLGISGDDIEAAPEAPAAPAEPAQVEQPAQPIQPPQQPASAPQPVQPVQLPQPAAPQVAPSAPSQPPSQPSVSQIPESQSLPIPSQPSSTLSANAASFLGAHVPSISPSHSQPASQLTASATSPLSFPSFGQPQAVQQQQQAPSQPSIQPQHQHSYSQHGLPTHLDPTSNQPLAHQLQPPSQPQPQQNNYYRQQDYGFHTPTPPVQQQQQQQPLPQQQQQQGLQHDQSGYAGFAPLAQAQISGFTPGQDYSAFADGRNFYENPYAPPMNSVFGGRNILGHEEVNKLTASQQPQPPSSNPLSNTSSQQSQQNPSQSQTSANQPPAGQGQQNYAPPVPYYYNPYYGQPNPYYGQPNPGYGLTQPFMKYPPMYQAGPPAPGPGTPSATPAKGPNTGAPPPGPNSYGTHAANHLYGQQHHVGGYDDGAYGHQQQQHHPQHQHQQQHQSALSGSQTGDYGKPPLYGLSHNQNFLGQNPVSQAALGRGVGQVNQPGANSPETPYKHYGGPSVGAVVNDKTGGVGGASQTHTQPGRGGVQQNAGTGYYGAGNRFPSSSGGGPQQAQGPPGQQGQGYPQGNETPYYYRGQQYWQ